MLLEARDACIDTAIGDAYNIVVIGERERLAILEAEVTLVIILMCEHRKETSVYTYRDHDIAKREARVD